MTTTQKLEIFVIFHKKVFPEMYEELDEEERKCFTFVAVNEEIPEKECPYEYIREWELPVYHPEWQKNNWMNGGVNHHIMLNKLSSADYIGFVQYDMKFTKGSVKRLLNELDPDTGFTIKTMDFLTLLGTSTFGFSESDMYKYAVDTLGQLKASQFPLYHNCFMLRDHYEKIMPDPLLSIDTHLYEAHHQNRPSDPYYRFAITTERTIAFAIATCVSKIVEFPGITHEKLKV